ncbi:zeta toxin family protein [Sphingomonas bacterium]|uniref:zeta toxin family protein n=1 Tax=Sphingomonas bacterium TaxID=1895847 RepID=UPI001575DC34|nr:zeta toxin family protein [Sphingomonas bacterium]
MTTPILWVIAGPNGAGKTTLFNDMLRGHVPYVNADEIAAELDPASNAIEIIRAGRLAVERRNAMVARRESLSIETTLAGSSALAFMRKAKATGYRISLAYVGIDTPELSRARINDRVQEGGHDVPEDAVVRRHPDSLRRLTAAMEIADSTMIFDNSGLERRLLLHVEDGHAKFIEIGFPNWFSVAVPEHMRRFAGRRRGMSGAINDLSGR